MRKWFHVTQADFEGAFGQIKFLFLVSEFLEAGILCSAEDVAAIAGYVLLFLTV